MGQGVHYRAGVFDGAISISAVQWLCNADKKGHSPPKRLYQFFKTLYSTLRHGARAVLQVNNFFNRAADSKANFVGQIFFNSSSKGGQH
jgi:hypothetical protein